MIEQHFNTIVLIWILIAVLLFPLLIRVKAPYGRHTTKKWGTLVNNRIGWIVMEIPSLALFMILFLTGDIHNAGICWVFFSLWVIHYINRIFIFPPRIRTRGKKMPLLILLFATFFNLVNGFINGYWLGFLAKSKELRAKGEELGSQVVVDPLINNTGPDNWQSLYSIDWLTDPRFILGISLFIAGFIINQAADTYLISLRKGGKTGYYIPRHSLFKYISCPNFLGEIIEWTGFAIMTWSLPGLSFAIWTAANLIPRAIHHHRWYKNEFPDYPENRKAIIPGLL